MPGRTYLPQLVQPSRKDSSPGPGLGRRPKSRGSGRLRTCGSPFSPTCWAGAASCWTFCITRCPRTIPRSRNKNGASSTPGFQEIVRGRMEGARGLHTPLHPFYPSQHVKQRHLDFPKQLLLTLWNKKLPQRRAHCRGFLFYSLSPV